MHTLFKIYSNERGSLSNFDNLLYFNSPFHLPEIKENIIKVHGKILCVSRLECHCHIATD